MKINREYVDYYEKNIDDNYFDHHHKVRQRKTVENVKKLINKTSDKKKILDLGAGTGQIVSKLYGGVYGCDISYNALKIAKKRSNHLFIRADGQKSPFKSKCFDIIILADIVEHVPQPKELIREAYRLLKTNGKIVLIIPNGSGISQTYDKHDKNRVFHHLNFFSKNDIEQLTNMFSIQKFENLTIFPCAPELGRKLLSGFGVFYFIDALANKLPLIMGDEWLLVLLKT